MAGTIDPYLDVLRRELATTLMPRDDENARRVATYCRRTLVQLQLGTTLLPSLQQHALEKLSALLDNLIAELAAAGAPPTLTTGLIAAIRTRPDFAQMETLMQSAVDILGRLPSERSAALMAAIAAINFDIQETLWKAAQGEEILPQSDDFTAALDEKQKLTLRDYLRQKYPAETNIDIGKVRAIVGGGSKLTLFVDLLDAIDLPACVVLRLDKADGVVASTVADEFFLLTIMHNEGLPVPKPYLVEQDRAILGAPFVMVSRVEGRNIGDWLDVFEPSREFAIGMARTLAKMHSISPDAVGNRLPGHDVSTKERVAREMANFEEHWRRSGQTSVALEQAYAWLKSHLDWAEGRRAIVHGDVGCHNMLGEDGALTALLDWETAVIGNPAQDIAYVRHIVVQMMPWEEFLAEYESAGGRIPNPEELDFYRLWRGVFSFHFAIVAKSYFNSGMSSAFLAYASQVLYQRLGHHLHETVSLLYGNQR